MSDEESRGADRTAAVVRLSIGLGQGLGAWLLIRGSSQAWSAHAPGLFAALVLVTAFPPLIVLAGFGHLRWKTLLWWTIAACAVVALLSLYDLWREPLGVYTSPGGLRRWPSAQLVAVSAAGLYIAHHLIEPADAERRLWPSYQARFERAWRHGFQLALSLAFTGIFWLVLQLGAGLFDMIGVKSVGQIINRAWFASPATAIAFAGAVHLTDVRPQLIRGLRTVGLTLLAWLAPLAVGLTVAFLITLPFTGLDKLWATRRTASLLLSAAALLIVLINAAYQDGRDRETLPALLRWAVRLGAVLLVPLTLLAAWASLLRVEQYGLTPERVVSLALLLVAAIYAGGYTWAAVSTGSWMCRLEPVNVSAAVVMLALILALLSPVADPARLSTDDQMHRLATRRVPVSHFDFTFFRFRAARFGRRALDRLVASSDPEISSRAHLAKVLTSPYPIRGSEPETQEAAFSHARILPAATVLPSSFRTQDWTSEQAGFGVGCLTEGSACDLYVQDLNGDGRPEVLVSSTGILVAYGQQAIGRWIRLGQYGNIACPNVREALLKGHFSTLAPLAQDLDVGGQRLSFQPNGDCQSKVKPSAQQPSQPGGLGPAFTRRYDQLAADQKLATTALGQRRH